VCVRGKVVVACVASATLLNALPLHRGEVEVSGGHALTDGCTTILACRDCPFF
jgi:hypothetical protein